MLSTTSSKELRRKTHRRQNSTPTLEVPNVRPFPAPLARSHSHRGGHRRGLSLDQHISLQPRERMIPTLGSIAQDDIAVSLTDTGHQHQHPQHPLQVAQQHSLAQPGQRQQYEHERYFPPLPRPPPPQQQQQHHHHSTHSLETSHLSCSPEHSSTPAVEMRPPQQRMISPSTPHRQHFAPSPLRQEFPSSPQMSSPGTMGSAQPLAESCEEAVKKLKESVEAFYGPGSNVFINILPTPVATPQKRDANISLPQLDTTPIPFDFAGNVGLGLGLGQSSNAHSFECQTSADGSMYSPGFGTPARSPYQSPQQQALQLMGQQSMHLSFDDQPVLIHAPFNSSQATLADVEPLYSPPPGTSSPEHSPHQVSIADLSLDTLVEETGISSEEVASLIAHDPVTGSFSCLFEGCDRKGFQRRENVRSHVQTHLGDRQYKCIHCGKTFVRPHDLKRHAKIHSGVKPYRCPCGQEFVRQDALTRHRQRGSCSGAFPDAIPRTPARRGRPRKKRPDMDDRLEKANRTRELNASNPSVDEGDRSSRGSGSEAGGSPSPPATAGAPEYDFSSLDTAKFGDFGEEEGEQAREENDTEPFSFDSMESTSTGEDSSPFIATAASDMLFQFSSSSTTAPTPPDSPTMKGEPFIMQDILAMQHESDDVFFGANDMKDSSGFWM